MITVSQLIADVQLHTLTVVIVSVEMDVVRRVSQVDVSLAVRPALYHDAAGLPVEGKESAIEMT